MKEFKITGYVKVGFSKIVECESYEEAVQQANVIELTEDVDTCDLYDWYDEVEVEEIEENEE
jgi:hypothetical protein|nr:MAG TPA: L-proline 3-hydroxylase [Caudoviricetes sp.]